MESQKSKEAKRYANSMTWKSTLYMPEICEAPLSPCGVPRRCGTRACMGGRQPSPGTCHPLRQTIHTHFPWHPDILVLQSFAQSRGFVKHGQHYLSEGVP